ncbi:hypothetical protein MBLNU13_g09338t1 [Cladosporium sp. NU13]
MLPVALLALSLLGFMTCDTLNAVRVPAYRKPLNANSPVLKHPVTYNERFAAGQWFTQLSLGTPPRHVEVLLDTGSSDLWLPSARLADCRQSECPGGSFDQTKSTTCQTDERPPFFIQYVDDSRVVGNYLLDTLAVGDCQVANFSFAAATAASASIQHNGLTTGILGLNTAVGKSQCFNGDCTDARLVKPTISEAMASAGCIGSSSYSLFLDEDNARSPSILFGGLDTARFTGPLVTLHTKLHANESLPDRHVRQSLRLAKMTTRLNGTVQQTYRPAKGKDAVSIDTGSKGLVLPDEWVSSIFNSLQHIFVGGKTTSYATKMVISCDDYDADLVVPLGLFNIDTTEALEDYGIPGANASDICVVNLIRSANVDHIDHIILGDPFFRSAYTYNHLDQNTISIARPAYDSKDKERIIPIGRGPVPKLYGTG